MEYSYNRKSIWKWIVLYVAIGAVAYGLIYYFFFFKKGGYSYNNQDTGYNNQTETAEWKTYTNTEYGFEFKTPENFEVTNNKNVFIINGPMPKNDPEIGYASDDTMVLVVEGNPSKLGPENWLGNYSQVKKITVAGQEAIVAELYGTEASPMYLFVNPNKSFAYVVQSNFGLSTEMVEKILSTFKFTK